MFLNRIQSHEISRYVLLFSHRYVVQSKIEIITVICLMIRFEQSGLNSAKIVT